MIGTLSSATHNNATGNVKVEPTVDRVPVQEERFRLVHPETETAPEINAKADKRNSNGPQATTMHTIAATQTRIDNVFSSGGMIRQVPFWTIVSRSH